MTAKIREQILEIRSTGICNMFSVHEVQRLAFERGYYELVIYLSEEVGEYVRFIMYGDEGIEKTENDEEVEKGSTL